MTEQTPVSQPKKKRDPSKKLTFVYTEEGVVRLKSHKTIKFSVAEAWKEVGLDGENIKFVGAVNGHVAFLDNKLRKPTYEELVKLAGI